MDMVEEEDGGFVLAESPGIIPFFPSIMALQPAQDDQFNASQCICSDLQHEDYSPLYAWFNYIVIIIMLPSLSAFGVVTNLVNVFVYSRPRMRNSSNTYLLFLACSDFFVVVTGLFIFWIDSARSYIPQLVQAPYTTVYTLPFGYMAQSCSIYFTVAAAFDCYVCVCWRQRSKQHCTVRRARRIVAAILLCSVVYNSLRFPQFNLRKCIHDGSGELVVEICPTSLFFRINTIYNVYLYMFVMTLFPFMVLLLLNALIICRKSLDANKTRLCKKKSTSSSIASLPAHPQLADGSLGNGQPPQTNGHNPASAAGINSRRASLPSSRSQQQFNNGHLQQNGGTRPAAAHQTHIAAALLGGPLAKFPELPKAVNPGSDETITMIMVVVLFLCCNTLALIVNLIETFFEPDALLLNLLSDASNFLVIFNSSVNCVIYLIFNNEYREVFLAHFVHFKGRCFPFHLFQCLFDWKWNNNGRGNGRNPDGNAVVSMHNGNGREREGRDGRYRKQEADEVKKPLADSPAESPIWLQCPCTTTTSTSPPRHFCHHHHCPCWLPNNRCGGNLHWCAAPREGAIKVANEEFGDGDSGCDESSQQRASPRGSSSMCPSPTATGGIRSCYLAEVKMILGDGQDGLAMPSPPHIYVRPLMRRAGAGGFELQMNNRGYNPAELGDGREILIDSDAGDFPVTAL